MNYWVRSIQPKFPGWGSKTYCCRLDRNGFEGFRSIPLRAKRVSRSSNMEDVGSVARIRSRWRFRRWCQWYCVSCFIHSNLTSIVYQSNRSFDIHPRTDPRAFEFLENICSNSPLPRPKCCSNASSPRKLPDYCFSSTHCFFSGQF